MSGLIYHKVPKKYYKQWLHQEVKMPNFIMLSQWKLIKYLQRYRWTFIKFNNLEWDIMQMLILGMYNSKNNQ